MEFLIMAVKDKVTGEFLQPIFVHNHEEAKRYFAWQLENTPTWKENAEQFELYDLGMLDTETGNIIGNDTLPFSDVPIIHPDYVCKGTDLIDSRKE